jgi:hypothetical protein
VTETQRTLRGVERDRRVRQRRAGGWALQRPYTYFLHNLLELVPILAALIDEIAEARPQSRRPIPTSS